MSDPVRVNGVIVGHTSAGPVRRHKGGVSISATFKPEPIGILHAWARELDRER